MADNLVNITKNAMDIASFNSSGKSFISEVLNHLFFKCISTFSFLNRVRFDSRKINVLNIKTGDFAS